MIDSAENRFKFSRLLDNIGTLQPRWKVLTTLEVSFVVFFPQESAMTSASSAIFLSRPQGFSQSSGNIAPKDFRPVFATRSGKSCDGAMMAPEDSKVQMDWLFPF